MTIMQSLPPQFIATHVTQNPATGKLDKIPINPTTREAIDPHDPSHWMSYDEACAASPTVGFVLTRNDPYVFLDFDGCRTEDGEWDEAVKTATDAYLRRGVAVEVSISGEGLHILCTADQLAMEPLRSKLDGWRERYHWGRFIQLGGTGHGAWQGDPHWDCTDLILASWPQKEAMDHDGIPETGPVEDWIGPEDDETLINIMLTARPSADAAFGTKATFRQLWTGDVDALGRFYPSFTPDKPWDASSAEAALATHLAFWTGRDLARIERLIRMSRVRHTPDQRKYERPSYVMPTIRGAAALVTNTYQNRAMVQAIEAKEKKTPDEVAGASAPGEVGEANVTGGNTHKQCDFSHGQFLTSFDQEQYFSGCVYVTRRHEVLMPDGRFLDQRRFNVEMGGHEFQMEHSGARPTRDAWEAFTLSRCVAFPKAKATRLDARAAFGDIDTMGCVNVLRLPEVTMGDGDVTPFLDHLAKLLPVERDQQIILSWMAACVQNRASMFQWAPVVQGAEGNGKTFLLECLQYAVGESVTHVPNAEDMNEKYNGYMETSLLIGVEEIHMRSRRDLLDRLKRYIGGRRVEVRRMGTDKYMADNLTKWFFLTNFQDAVLTNRNDRRFSVFFTAQQSADDILRDGMTQEYFAKLWDWARDGGFADVAGYLSRVEPVEAFDPMRGAANRAPATSSRAASLAASMGPFEQHIVEAIEQEMSGFRGGWLSSHMVQKLLAGGSVKKTANAVTPRKLSEIIENLGFQKFGRAPRKILQEDNSKPRLYFNPEICPNPTFEQYILLQGYEEPKIGIIRTQ